MTQSLKIDPPRARLRVTMRWFGNNSVVRNGTA